MNIHAFALILVIIGVALVALDWILAATPRTSVGPRTARSALLHIGVILIGIGVMLGVKTLS